LVSQLRIRKITRASRSKLLELERKYAIILNQFVNQNITPKMELIPADSLRRQYEAQIKSKIRAMVEEAYLEGNQQVGREIQRVMPMFDLFTSRTDSANIQQKTDELNNEFWATITWITGRRNEFVVKQATKTKEAELEKKPEFDQKAAMIGLATGIAFGSFNKAIKSKTQIVKTLAPQFTQGITPSAVITFRRLDAKVMFLTREDPDVDPQICAPLNRTVYDVGDPSIPEPIKDTHKHCRCQLVPLVDEVAQTDANSLLF